MATIIIGAGPAGCFAGANLKDCVIFEEHNKIGAPVQCSGLMTQDINTLVMGDFVINKISSAEIITQYSRIRFKLKERNLVVDRARFDTRLGQLAEDNGCRIHTGCKAVGFKDNCVVVRHKNSNKIIKYDNLVGADGPLSVVRKQFFRTKPLIWQGLQARAKMKNDNEIKFFPKIGVFSWIIPESEKIVRIGVVSRQNPRQIFDRFVKNRIKSKDIIEFQGGLIPLYDPQFAASRSNVFLVGDAAGHVKATTGGGIIPCMIAAKALAYSIKNSKDYEREWRRAIGKDLFFSLLMRRVADRMNENDFSKLIQKLKEPALMETIETISRDNATKLLLKLLIKKPELMLYARYLL